MHVCSLYRNTFSGPHLSYNTTTVTVRIAILPIDGMYIAIQLYSYSDIVVKITYFIKQTAAKLLQEFSYVILQPNIHR